MKAMKAPKFWEEDSLKAKLLSPLSFFYKKSTAARVSKPGYKSSLPVICVGNITAGGSGKTPVAMAIARLLQADGKTPNFVSKGYGRTSEETLKVQNHKPEQVGDEPLLLARIAPTFVSTSREEGAKKAEENKADIILLDDGFQDPTLEKTLSFLVIDGAYGLGNKKVIPAGPLREPFEEAIERADAIIVVGELKKKLPETNKPILKANINVHIPELLREDDVVAYCGIGIPAKFYASLRAAGVNVVNELAYPDHHSYSEQDFKDIFAIATERQAVVFTTEKDYVKVPEHLKKLISPIKAELVFEDEAAVRELLKKCYA